MQGNRQLFKAREDCDHKIIYTRNDTITNLGVDMVIDWKIVIGEIYMEPTLPYN